MASAADFQHKPYLRDSILQEHGDELLAIEAGIRTGLRDYPNFDGIDFCDVRAGGIQIRGHHKEVKGYTYGDQITILYDFSNKQGSVEQFVEMWKKADTQEELLRYQRFLRDGEKYGWD